MKWEKENAIDIVVGASAKVAEDMVHGTAALVKDAGRYYSMYTNMANTLKKTNHNLNKYILSKKWPNNKTKAKVRHRMKQIEQIMVLCGKMAEICSRQGEAAIHVLSQLEGNKNLKDIVDRIDLPKSQEDKGEDD